jgi:xanthine dehydrogenase accessory factor
VPLSTENHDHVSDPRARPTDRRVLIIGGGDIGSAVAHILFDCGLKVVICERQRSSHARRGMAFTDSLFDGRSTLAGVDARLEADLPGILARWEAGDAIPITTTPEALLAAAMRFDVVVDATMRRDHEPPDQRALTDLFIGLGPGYEPGRNCHVAIETQWGLSMGSVLRDRSAAVRSGGPRALAGVTRERFAVAPCSGKWHTTAALGQALRAGDPVGQLGGHLILAPISGHLRGLSRDGVEVMAGQRLLEVDPRPMPEINGLGERPLAIAAGVAEALGLVPFAKDAGY